MEWTSPGVAKFAAHEMSIEVETPAHLSVIGPGFSTFNKLPGDANAAGPQVTLGGAQASGAYATHPIALKPENTERFQAEQVKWP